MPVDRKRPQGKPEVRSLRGALLAEEVHGEGHRQQLLLKALPSGIQAAQREKVEAG
jgi:hypothetical protein